MKEVNCVCGTKVKQKDMDAYKELEKDTMPSKLPSELNLSCFFPSLDIFRQLNKIYPLLFVIPLCFFLRTTSSNWSNQM